MDKIIRLKVKEIFEDTKKKHLQVQTRKSDALTKKDIAETIFSRSSHHNR